MIISGFVRCSFADSLRALLIGLLIGLDFDFNEIETFMQEGKEWTIPGIDKSFRQLMQTLGTEWGREMIHPDIWVMIERCRIESLSDMNIVFDDVRFENEAALIREMGGLIIHIDRGDLILDLHSSEAGIDIHPADIYVSNDHSLEDFLKEIGLIVAHDITPTPSGTEQT